MHDMNLLSYLFLHRNIIIFLNIFLVILDYFNILTLKIKKIIF
jgi:hypothetical protein